MKAVSQYALTMARLHAEALPVSGHRDVWDARCPGLLVRFTSKAASFYLSKWVSGAQRWIRLGALPPKHGAGLSVEDARRRATDLLGEIAKGARPWEARKALRDEETLDGVWTHYRVHHAKIHKRASSLASDDSIWTSVLAPWSGRKRLGEITRQAVQRLIATKGKTTPIRANRTLALLSKMFNRAIADGLWKGENPAKGVQRFPEVSRDRFLRPDELRALFASLAHEEESWRVYFLAAVLCGARRANLLAMRWSDLNLSRGLWQVPGEQSKNGSPLAIVLPVELVKALTGWKSRCPSPTWCFPSEDSETGHKTEPKGPWARVLLRAEGFRLIHAMAAHEGRPGMSDDEHSTFIAEAEEARVLALGRRRKLAGDPLEAALERVRDRARAAGLDTEDGSMRAVRMHDLRRTLGSWQAITGASTAIIGKSLGHRSVQTTAVYARLDLDPVRASVEKAAGAMLAHA